MAFELPENSQIEAQKQIDADPENAKKISIGQLAVMEYNTYLLDLEVFGT